MAEMDRWSSEWATITPHQEITLRISGSVHKHPKAPGSLYVTLVFGRAFEITLADDLARQLRDWLNAQVPDAEPE